MKFWSTGSPDLDYQWDKVQQINIITPLETIVEEISKKKNSVTFKRNYFNLVFTFVST